MCDHIHCNPQGTLGEQRSNHRTEQADETQSAHVVLDCSAQRLALLDLEIVSGHLLWQLGLLATALCTLSLHVALLAACEELRDVAALCTVHCELDAVKRLPAALQLRQLRLVLVQNVLDLHRTPAISTAGQPTARAAATLNFQRRRQHSAIAAERGEAQHDPQQVATQIALNSDSSKQLSHGDAHRVAVVRAHAAWSP
jgi:hypothetical protein